MKMMHLHTLTRTVLSLLILQHQTVVDAARSISARRVRGAPNARAADRYDRSITTFSPEGRLLQLEYALIAAEERGRGLTVCVECDGVVIFAFPSIDDTSSLAPSGDSVDEDADSKIGREQTQSSLIAATEIEYDPSHNTKIHRLSPTQLLLTSGLAGDSRLLASSFRRVTSAWTHINYGEVITSRELAKEMGKVRHSIGLRPGARVLGVVGMLIGLDDVDDDFEAMSDDHLGVEVRMYRSLPGGTMDRCTVCCTGGGADASGNVARKDAMDTLLDVVSQRKGDNGDEEMISKDHQKLQHVIEEVGNVVLKYHPDSQNSKDSSLEDVADAKANKRIAVDIWIVRASREIPYKDMDINNATVNHHRFLGKALMDTRYARRVALDQLSAAAKCLMAENTKI